MVPRLYAGVNRHVKQVETEILEHRRLNIIDRLKGSAVTLGFYQ